MKYKTKFSIYLASALSTFIVSIALIIYYHIDNIFYISGLAFVVSSTVTYLCYRISILKED